MVAEGSGQVDVSMVKKSLNNVNLNTSMDIREESEEMTVRKQQLTNNRGVSEHNTSDHSAAFSDDSSR